MNTTTQIINPDSCIHVMEAFWREQMETAETRDGLALTLPLMYPDGWQVSVFLSATTPGRVQISDQGKTLGALQQAGMNLDAKPTGRVDPLKGPSPAAARSGRATLRRGTGQHSAFDLPT